MIKRFLILVAIAFLMGAVSIMQFGVVYEIPFFNYPISAILLIGIAVFILMMVLLRGLMAC